MKAFFNVDEPVATTPEVAGRIILTPSGAATLPTLYQPDSYDTSQLDAVTLENWDTLEFGFDQMEAAIVEQYRQRGKATAAKARAAYSKEVVAGLGKPAA
jgi:hypothetical protein